MQRPYRVERHGARRLPIGSRSGLLSLILVLAIGFWASLGIAPIAASPVVSSTATLVIFPFSVGDGIDSRVGPDYAAKLGTAISSAGEIKVVIAGDTEPSGYLRVARADNADYYLMGSVAPPLNNRAAVIEQIVSARSGILVWSSTMYVSPDLDVRDQGPLIKEALAAYETRGYSTILNSPRDTPNAPTRTSDEERSSASRAASRSRNAPPSALPDDSTTVSAEEKNIPAVAYALANRPTRFVVLQIASTVGPPLVRQYATSSIVAALRHSGDSVAEGDPATTQFPAIRGPEICANTRAHYLVFGSVVATSLTRNAENNYVPWTDAYLKIAVYDCDAQRLRVFPKALHGGATDWQGAIDGASRLAVKEDVLKIAVPVAPS